MRARLHDLDAKIQPAPKTPVEEGSDGAKFGTEVGRRRRYPMNAQQTISLQRTVGNQAVGAMLSASPSPQQAADLATEGEHFEPGGGATLAAYMRVLYGINEIVAESGAGKWTGQQVEQLYLALSLVPPRQIGILAESSIAKCANTNDVLGAFVCDEGGENQMKIMTAAFNHSQETLRIAVLHELGHGYVCQHPSLVKQFGTMAGKSGLMSESKVRGIVGPIYAEYVWGDVKQGGMEEYLVTAFAVLHVSPSRIPEKLAKWLKRMF